MLARRSAVSGAAMDAGEAVALLATGTGEPYALVGRLTGGETGAHRVSGPGGRPLVVKWDLDPTSQSLRKEAVALTDRLRTEAGWPVPRQWTVDVDDWLFVIQELMPGAPVETLGHTTVDRLLDLHARRLVLTPSPAPSRWPRALIETLTVGGRNYCLHGSLRDYDERTAALVSRIEAFGRGLHPEDLTARDVIHRDLHPGNLLVDEGGLTAIVDTDFATVGDSAFDLVSLALASLALPCERGVRSRLFAAFEGLDEVRRQTYLAHLFIKNLDWPIRRGRPGHVEFWLERADQMLTV
jgi:Ser/Thr protein kinase RdoA (MazF antagonist)